MRFSVITPTYNRAHTLPALHDALVLQTLQDFEWVIIDDGSDDDTAALVRDWQETSSIKIVYQMQPNCGKPSAVNAGVSLAAGELVTILDSDDTCYPNALEQFNRIWLSIPSLEREGFSGVTTNCATSSGDLVGSLFPGDAVDDSPLNVWYRLRVRGEKWGFHRADVLQRYPYPIVAGETFVPEGIVWNRIAHKYLVRHTNDILRTYLPDDSGLAARIGDLRIENPVGTTQYYLELMGYDIPLGRKVIAATMMARYARHAGRSLCWTLRHGGRLLTSVTTGAGYILWVIDRARRLKHHSTQSSWGRTVL